MSFFILCYFMTHLASVGENHFCIGAVVATAPQAVDIAAYPPIVLSTGIG